MKNKSLRFKLYALSSFLILLSVIVGIIGYISEIKIVNEYSYIAERNLPNIKSMGLMISRYRLARALATELAITEISKERAHDTIKNYHETWQGFEEEHKKYLNIEFAPGEDELYQDFKTKYLAIKASLDKIISLYEEGEKQGSVDQKKISQIIFGEAAANGNAMRDAGNKILGFHVERADLRGDTAKAITQSSTYTILATILIGTAVGVLFAVTFSNTLVTTLTKISQALNQAGMEVSSGSNQIASTAQELSQATTEQSASLEQTAASIEEMNSMVQKSAENAKMTYTYAVNSKESAVTGKEVVVEMIESIEEINKSNQDIMIAIDESNKKMEEIALVIGDIANKTKVINDIVFQTKLLSFNASVEAARAGEMGKGFAVVAEEVGNLAEMSGKASKEISDMLTSSIAKVDDIVRTTKARVEHLVEVGKKKVHTGTTIAKKCGDVLDTIVTNVDDVNKLASEISEASEEQAKGIQEISKAAGMLETVTQQNSTASEESARASEELSRQAMSLNQIVFDLVAAINGNTNRRVEQNGNKENILPLKRVEKQIISKRSSNFKKASGDFSAPAAEDNRFMDT